MYVCVCMCPCVGVHAYVPVCSVHREHLCGKSVLVSTRPCGGHRLMSAVFCYLSHYFDAGSLLKPLSHTYFR